jgi:ABC-type branched-subunit amino acid transport system substrate-binding protein
LKFGVIYEKKVVVLLDTCATDHVQLKPFLDVAVLAVTEQLIRVDEFNLISCSNEMESWKEDLIQTSDDSIASAVQWVEQIKPQTTPFKTNIVEGIMKALAHSEADAIYLFAHGDCTLRALDLLLEKVNKDISTLQSQISHTRSCYTAEPLIVNEKITH